MKAPKNWRNYLTIVENKYSKNEIEYVLELHLPEKKPKTIGYLYISKKTKQNFVKVVSVISSFRGKGCGSMLYEHAINKLGTLSTNYHEASSLAQKVWKRLIKKYSHRGDFLTGVLTVFDKGVDKKKKKK